MKPRGANRSVGVLVVAAAVSTVCLVAACAEPTVSYAAHYSLEVVNYSTERVRLEVVLDSHIFLDLPSGTQRSRFGRGILTVDRGDRRTFAMSAPHVRDSSEDNYLVRTFNGIPFLKRTQTLHTGATSIHLPGAVRI